MSHLQPTSRVGRRAARPASVGLLCIGLAACASGGPGPAAGTPASTAVPAATATAAGSSRDARVDAPPVTGFDGGTTLVGFTGRPASIQDTILREAPNRVWGVLPSVFRTLGVQARTMDPATYTIGLEAGRVARIEGGRLSTHLECGSGILGPNADSYDVTMTLLVQLAGHASGGTIVRTTLDAYARPRSSSGEPLHCASARTLERRVVELVQMELSGVSTRPVPATRGRIPVTGDRLRVECISSVGARRQVAEGEFLGASGENLLLGIGTPGTRVSLPAATVGAVQVREPRSRTKLAGVLGALAGGVAGGFWGRTWYEPENFDDNLHYRGEVFVVLGAVAGVAGGYLAGRIAGSFVRRSAWVDAPDDWALRFTGLTPDGAAPSQPPDCPAL